MRLATITILTLATGCTVALRPHAEDHAVQTQAMADACRGQAGNLTYPEAPCSADLQSDLDAMAEQAECILAIVYGEKCKGGE